MDIYKYTYIYIYIFIYTYYTFIVKQYKFFFHGQLIHIV